MNALQNGSMNRAIGFIGGKVTERKGIVENGCLPYWPCRELQAWVFSFPCLISSSFSFLFLLVGIGGASTHTCHSTKLMIPLTPLTLISHSTYRRYATIYTGSLIFFYKKKKKTLAGIVTVHAHARMHGTCVACMQYIRAV